MLVHHIVVFKRVFANVEIVAFNAGLGLGDGIGDEAIFNHIVLAYPEPFHDILQAVAAESANQIVFGRNEELRRTRVALPTGAAAELIINAPSLVALGADDMETALVLRLLSKLRIRRITT